MSGATFASVDPDPLTNRTGSPSPLRSKYSSMPFTAAIGTGTHVSEYRTAGGRRARSPRRALADEVRSPDVGAGLPTSAGAPAPRARARRDADVRSNRPPTPVPETSCAEAHVARRLPLGDWTPGGDRSTTTRPTQCRRAPGR